MIQIPPRSLAPGGVPSNDALDTTEQAASNAAQPDHSATGGGAGGADPLAKFNALFGAPPQGQSFHADKNGAGGGVTKTPAPVFDIAHTTDKQIEDLRKAGKQQLANTIENAQAAYSDFLAKNPGVQIVVTTSAGNGGHPVLVVRGPDYNKGAHVHTHYHGDNATVADPLGSKAGTNARIRDVIKNDPRAVFVLPEARNSTAQTDSPRNDNHYQASWSDVKSEVQTTEDALDAAGVKKVDEQVVSFHSGGGMALVNLMLADPKGKLLKADRLELYDCVYHFGKDNNPQFYFEDRLRDFSKTDNGKAVGQVIFYRGSNTDHVRKAAVIEGGFPPKDGKARFTLIDMAKEKPITDKDGRIDETIDPVAENAYGSAFDVVPTDKNGKQIGKAELAHNFNPDPHYRTTGQFLGSRPRS